MNKDKLFTLYEKAYFHEMATKDKFVGRVQLNFALIAAVYSVLSYMVRMIDYNQSLLALYMFYIAILFSVVFSLGSIRHLLKAFWGNEYKAMPTPNDTNNYRNECLSYNAKAALYNKERTEEKVEKIDVKKEMKNYLFDEFVKCATHNADVNDKRAKHIHESFRWQLVLSIPFALSCFVFIAWDLDVSSPRKETPIIDKGVSNNLSELSRAITKLQERPQFSDQITEELKNINIGLKQLNHELKRNITMSNTKPQQPQKPPQRPIRPPTRNVMDNDVLKPNAGKSNDGK